jgi:NAD(P)-dependent dehydrogenase (short-subunit alcohol dehydrogenase family)
MLVSKGYVCSSSSKSPQRSFIFISYYSIKVYVADRDLKSAQALTEELNKGKNDQVVWSVSVDVADWDSQCKAFEAAEAQFGRIDYVYPIAGIGERRSFPNRPHSKGYEKPDLAVLEVDAIGVFYTVSLALQHFRRQEPNKYGFRGKSKWHCSRLPWGCRDTRAYQTDLYLQS